MSLEIRELGFAGVLELTPRQFADERGVFLESYRYEGLQEAIGHRFEITQANLSVSAKGVVRGIHYADVPPSQAKYISCVSGALLDFIVDIRVGSSTFGRWESVLLDDIDHRAVYIPEGFGHCFVALADKTVATYMVSAVFNAPREHGINPLDADIGLVFPPEAGELMLSSKDTDAPGLVEALEAGLLPTLAEVAEFHAQLAAR